MAVETPVLFETFARPQYARKVFDQIKKAQPKKLYFYSNKARSDRPEEIKANEEIRAYINEIDWDCELHTYFREEYVDVYVSTRSSKNWIFENEEMAIVLEDDCVPSLAFFEFCDYFLKKYINDTSIGFISGANYVKKRNYGDADHIISCVSVFYGFATWRDRWFLAIKNMETFNIDTYIQKNLFYKYYSSPKLANLNEKRYSARKDFIYRTKVWDYEFSLSNILNQKYGVFPTVNLVRNIGADGTHTGQKILKLVSYIYEKSNYPFKSGNLYYINKKWDLKIYDILHGDSNITKIKKILIKIFGEKICLIIKRTFSNITSKRVNNLI